MSISFSFCGIGYGWLWMKIKIGRKYTIWSFDERLSNPLPNMVRMYMALKQGKDASWSEERGGTITFDTVFSDNKANVTFRVKVTENAQNGVFDETVSEDEYERMEIHGTADTISESLEGEIDLATDYLINEFEVFFNLLTSSKYYPVHYPCHSMLNHDEYDLICDKCDEYYKLKKDEYSSNFWEEYEKREIAQNVHLLPNGQKFYEEFDHMMNTFIVPDHWR